MTHKGSPVYVVGCASDAGPGYMTPISYVCTFRCMMSHDALVVERRIA